MINQFVNLNQVIESHASKMSDQVALTFVGKATAYQQLNLYANAIANAVLAAGLKRGDRICYLGKNSDLAIELALGASKAGIILVPIISRLSAKEIQFIAEDCNAQMFFVGKGLAELANNVFANMQTTSPAIYMDKCDLPVASQYPAFTEWRDAQPSTAPNVEVITSDVLLQLYTSGTTGRPKGVMLTHGNLTNFRPTIEAADLRWINPSIGEPALIVMPYAHIAGIGTALLALYSGQQLVILEEFEPGAVLAVIEEYKIERLFLVPAALQILLSHPSAATTDFSSLKYFCYGASPIPLDLLKEGMKVLECEMVQVYGMTETWGGVVALAPEDHDPKGNRLMTSAGRALPGVELRIVDNEGNELPRGTIGEISIRSQSNMLGYWNLPEETKRTIDDNGWLNSGDAGILDKNGYLFIQDRIKDMIISGGENIYPAEVENALYSHPDVADVAIIGVPDEKWGEAVKAIVVLRTGSSPDISGILKHAEISIARFKLPKTVDFIDVLPRNPSGKILRRQLRKPYWNKRSRQVN